MGLKSIPIVIAVIATIIFILYWQTFKSTFPMIEEIKEEENVAFPSESNSIKEVGTSAERRVPLEEIKTLLSPDGIPSIDNPKFIPVKEAEKFLNDSDPGVAFSSGNTHRFYPYKILVWHEIVNDTINGQRTLITYCPLCLTGYALDPLVKGERVEFGTSGKLWKSNLIMYDRKTKSLWSQVLAEAIDGEMIGTKLKILPSDQMLYGKWKATFPNGQVLSQDTGSARTYGYNPYAGGDYFKPDELALSLAGRLDPRLPNDTFVYGIIINGKAKAYDILSVKAEGGVEDRFEGEDIVLRYDNQLDVVIMYKKLPDGSEERINPISGFWFSWAAAHPSTELYK